ncbi:MAG: ATP-binding protein [Thermoleophilia bacterium]
MLRGLSRRILLAAAALGVVTALMVTLLYLEARAQRAALRDADHSTQVIATAADLERDILDLEAGEQDFAVSGQARFLEPVSAAQRASAGDLRRLRALLVDSPAQLARLARIDRAYRTYLGDWVEPVLEQARRDREAAIRLIATGQGALRVDGLQTEIDRLVDAETSVRATSLEGADDASRFLTWLVVAAVLSSVLLALGTGLYLTRAVGGPVMRLAAAARRLAPGDGGDTEDLDHLARAVDVTAQRVRATEDALRVTTGRAEAGERLAQAALDANPAAILLAGADGAVLLRNPAVASLPPGLAERALAMDGEGPDEVEDPGSGRVFWRSARPAGEDRRLVVVREVTTELAAERLKQELVSTASHELRTPLAAVLGFSELLLRDDLGDEARRRYARTIHREAGRLSELVGDLLDLDRIDRGRLDLEVERFDLAQLLDDAAAVCAARSPGHDVAVGEVPRPLWLEADRARTDQVVANLLSNAVKYSPGGGPVRVAAAERDGTVRITVTDRGLGIPAEELPRIFERFFRGESREVRGIGGSGLGLALCAEIVRAHGGRVGAESTPGEGTSVWAELPAAAGTAGTVPAA